MHASGDLIIPTLILRLLPPFWAGVFVAGPVAAIMSTVDTMLLLVSATIIKDLYIRYALKNDVSNVSQKAINRMSLCCTFGVGVIVFLASFNPPQLLVWINLFAFGGLEAVFLCPIVLGLYCKSANACGAVASILTGLAVFLILSAAKISPFGILPIVPALAAAVPAFLVGNRFGRPVPEDVRKVFWEER